MDALLSFFSNLILFTAGLAVAIFWIIAIIVVFIEGHDTIAEWLEEREKKEND